MSRQARQEEAEARNRTLWDELAGVHMGSYLEVGLLRRGEEILDPVELREVGDVDGRTLLHLQCHIGTDSLAWARHGAVVTGIDFSSEAIACAEKLSDELGISARFLRSNVYDLARVLDEEFDIVYTSRGVLCWLADIDEWARIVARFVKPGGIFYLLESHPILAALEERGPGHWAFDHRYFHEAEPTVWPAGDADYADPDHAQEHASLEWTWSLSEIVNALLTAGLRLEFLNEYEHCFFRYFPGMTSDNGRVYRVPGHEGKLPTLFTLRARKPR